MDGQTLPATGDSETPDFGSASDASKRRSSSRSIKRRRFDDELVEYGAAPPIVQPVKDEKRVRTQSYSSPFPEMLAASTASPAMPIPPVETAKRRHSSKPSSSGGSAMKRSKKKQLNQMITKDLGRWKPSDDLALIVGVQQTNDLRTVHRGIKFSCRFTLSEIQSRWYALMYNPEISRVAIAAMNNLHPDLVTYVKSKALFSNSEEELLSTFPSNSQPTIEKLQELLDQNPTVFYPTRTAKTLMNHWQLMKHYSLLPDQTVQPLPKGDNVLNFSDAEEMINDSDLQEPHDEALETELTITDRWAKKEIRLLENSQGRWQVLIDTITGVNSPDFDKHSLAILRGRNVKYIMKSREVTIGRSTADQPIDIDLSLEGPASKISRRQGTISLKASGDFYLVTEGNRPFYVDGQPVIHGTKTKLNNNSVIEISSLRLIFQINQDLVNAIRQESVKINAIGL